MIDSKTILDIAKQFLLSDPGKKLLEKAKNIDAQEVQDAIRAEIADIKEDRENIKNLTPEERKARRQERRQQIKNKKGKVILVKLIATSIFCKLPINPGAIIETNTGIKISIIIVKNNKPKKRKLKISLANLFDCFLPLIISDE